MDDSVHQSPITIHHSPISVGVLAGILAIVGGLVLAYGGWIAGAALLVGIAGTIIVLRELEVGFWGVIAIICPPAVRHDPNRCGANPHPCSMPL